jgi:hypothetical protein
MLVAGCLATVSATA